jgi:serine/threonine protein kinase
LDERFEPRVADFGTARTGVWDGTMTVTGQVGTPYYMAPELFAEEPAYGQGIDTFSFAITLWELVTGKRMKDAFAGKVGYAFQNAVKEGRLRPPLNDVREKWVADFLARAWSGDPQERPSFQQILEEFRANKFALLPGVDTGDVENYLSRIQQFEREQARSA